MFRLGGFLTDEAGSVYVDWIALTAGVVLLGALVLHEVYYAGIAPHVFGTDAMASDDLAQLDQAPRPAAIH